MPPVRRRPIDRLNAQPPHVRPGLPLARRPAGLLTLVLLFVSACTTTPTPGPGFLAAPEPEPGHARLYVFRVDPQHSLSTVEVAVDRRSQGRLRNGEYLTLVLDTGSHRVDFRQRGLAFASWGWNGQTIRARAGETIYLEISVRISAQPAPGSGRDVEIAGRESGSASENVFVQHRTRDVALEHLAQTTLRRE